MKFLKRQSESEKVFETMVKNPKTRLWGVAIKIWRGKTITFSKYSKIIIAAEFMDQVSNGQLDKDEDSYEE